MAIPTTAIQPTGATGEGGNSGLTRKITAKALKSALKLGKPNAAGEAFMPCIDCGKECGWNACQYLMYMVRDDVWSAAGFHEDDNACQECLAKRLNRMLVSEDYELAAVNFEAAPQFFPPSRLHGVYAAGKFKWDSFEEWLQEVDIQWHIAAKVLRADGAKAGSR